MYAVCRALKALKEAVSGQDGECHREQARTGFMSASRRPTAVEVLLSSAVAGRPSISTTTTSLTPVLVSQPYMASRSSTAWRRPKSWSDVLCGRRASKMSRHDERRNWNSSGARSSAGNREMCRGLFCESVSRPWS